MDPADPGYAFMLPADGGAEGGTRSLPWITPAVAGAGTLHSSAMSALKRKGLISRSRAPGVVG
jgi:hypothetical protein